MDSSPKDDGKERERTPEEENEELLAEREEIMRQLAEMGGNLEEKDSDDNDDENLYNYNTETGNPGSDDSNISENVDDSMFFNAEEVEVKQEIKEEESKSDTASLTVTKTVLDRIDNDKSLPLPEGWSIVAHNSGLPVYYHKFSRVVTHSKPYQSEGVIRDHDIPICAIPCLFRQKMDEKHRLIQECPDIKVKEEVPADTETCPHASGAKQPTEVKTEKISPEEYREYCERRFKFKEITITRFAKPVDRIEATQEKRANSMLKRAGFDLNYDQLKKANGEGEILLTSASGITFIDLTYVDTRKRSATKKPYLMNPMGKSSVAVLNEFIQRLVKGSLVYVIDDTRNVTCPYQATAKLTIKNSQIKELAGQCKQSMIVLIEIATMHGTPTDPAGDVPADCIRFAIGRGVGANKKVARLEAATDALSKLIPKLRVSSMHVCDGVQEEVNKKGFEEESRELFKKVKIDSQSLVEMCARFAIPKPYGLLKDAVSRSMRWNGMDLITSKELVGAGHQMSKVTLKLGDMVASAEAIGIKQATQFASQLLLKEMHPDVLTYGGFLEMYGRFDDKEKLEHAKKQHDEVVRLQDTGNLLKPNFIVLSKLAEEMKDITLVHPPRKFLYGLSPNAAYNNAEVESIHSQYQVEDFIPTRPMPLAGSDLPSPMIVNRIDSISPLSNAIDPRSNPSDPRNYPMAPVPAFQNYPAPFPFISQAPQFQMQPPQHQMPPPQFQQQSPHSQQNWNPRKRGPPSGHHPPPQHPKMPYPPHRPF